MHQFFFGTIAALLYAAAIAVAVGDFGADTTVSFRVKGAVGFLILAIYFTFASRREGRSRREDPKGGEPGIELDAVLTKGEPLSAALEKLSRKYDVITLPRNYGDPGKTCSVEIETEDVIFLVHAHETQVTGWSAK